MLTPEAKRAIREAEELAKAMTAAYEETINADPNFQRPSLARLTTALEEFNKRRGFLKKEMGLNISIRVHAKDTVLSVDNLEEAVDLNKEDRKFLKSIKIKIEEG